MHIDALFDSGNIECLDSQDSQQIRLRIRKDAQSDFFQWFHFRVSGAKDTACKFIIKMPTRVHTPKAGTATKARYSYNRRDWKARRHKLRRPQCPHRGHTPSQDIVYFAYFAPFSLEQHHNLLVSLVSKGAKHEVLGQTLDGRSIDLLRIGNPESNRKCWLIARQHPGESMAEWWMKGFWSA